MKKIIVISILLISSTFTAICQDLSWVKLNGPYGGKVNCIAVNEQGTLFAGVKGIYRSDNDGDLWTEIETIFSEIDIFRIIPTKTGGIYACSSNEIFFSNDNGENWSNTNYNFGFIINGFAVNSTGIAFVATDKGLFKSEDNGNSWIQPNAELTDSSIYAITITPDDNIYIVTKVNILRSEDVGLNWSSVYTTEYKMNNDCFLGNDNQSNIYFNFIKSIISKDKGKNWFEIQSSYNNLFVCDVAEDNDGNVYLCDKQYYDLPYILVSNSGNPFEVQHTEFHLSKIISSKTKNLIALDFNEGIYQSKDHGKTWIEKNNGLTSTSAQSLVTNSLGDVFTLTENGSIKISSDYGNSWKGVGGLAYSLTIDNSDNIYANFEIFIDWGIYEIDFKYSTNKGENWKVIWPSIANFICENMVFDKNDTLYYLSGPGIGRYPNRKPYYPINLKADKYITALSISTNEYIFAALEKDGIYKTTDKGDNWQLIKIVDDTNSKILGVTTGALGYVYSWENGKIFKSSDDGDKCNEVLSKDSINYVLDIKADLKGNVFASFKDLGVFMSTDYGDTWEPLNTGLKSKNINIFNIAPNNVVYAGTVGKGLYALDLSTDIEESESFHNEIIISPNPASNNIEIQINNLEPGNITLTLFDIFGKEISTIYNGYSNRDLKLNHQFGNISSGTYFVVLSTVVEKKATRIVVSN